MEPNDLIIGNSVLFKKMKKLADTQERLIEEGIINEFLETTKKRERLKNEISSNIKRYRSITKNDTSSDAMKRSENISGEIADVIRSIQETDRRIEEFIQKKKDAVLFDIRNMRKGRKAVRNYGGQVSKNPLFIDRQG